MLKELSKYENLGTPAYFWELLNQIALPEEHWKEEDVYKFFFNRVIDDRTVFDGCLHLLISCEVIEINGYGVLNMDSSLQRCLINEMYLKNKMLNRIFNTFLKDEIFHTIFNASNISFDIVYNYIQIDNSAFTFKYSNFKQLLLDYDFLFIHPDKKLKKYIINPKYKKYFDKNILPEMKKFKLGIEDLDQKLAEQRVYGEEAEEFVVLFEKERLQESPYHKEIEKISDYDVSAGYDVVSFNDNVSKIHDRFIEVKSYVGDFNFFWSENEIKVSQLKLDSYYLYLVNRDKMALPGYVPEMIQNPYESVFNDGEKWNLRPKKYFVSIKSSDK